MNAFVHPTGEAAGLPAHSLLAYQGPRSSPPAASPATSSPLSLACLEPVLAVALVRWQQGMAVATEVSCRWQWAWVPTRALAELQESSRNRCRKRVLGANPSSTEAGQPRGESGCPSRSEGSFELGRRRGDPGLGRAWKMARARWKSLWVVDLPDRGPTGGSSGTAVGCPGEARYGGAPGGLAPLLPGHPVTVKSADRSSTWTS
jgi:hypothetical protein